MCTHVVCQVCVGESLPRTMRHSVRLFVGSSPLCKWITLANARWPVWHIPERFDVGSVRDHCPCQAALIAYVVILTHVFDPTRYWFQQYKHCASTTVVIFHDMHWKQRKVKQIDNFGIQLESLLFSINLVIFSHHDRIMKLLQEYYHTVNKLIIDVLNLTINYTNKISD